MADSRRIEVVPTDRFPSYFADGDADRFASWGVVGQEHATQADLVRWSDSLRSVAAVAIASRSAPMTMSSRSPEPAPTTVRTPVTTFRRLIDVPGDRLAVALNGWWQRGAHDVGHLRIDVVREVDGAWSLGGAFRATAISRSLPIELLLSPYWGRWTKLELMPRRRTTPHRSYFREGNRALDRFVAALSAHGVRDLGREVV